ncbi:MAG: ArsR family transcriptional regulator [Nitrosopumilus sp.]
MKTITVKTIETAAHPETKKVFWNLFASTRGAANRVKIMSLLRNRPSNTNQISTNGEMDYKSASHHLKTLEENYLVEKLHSQGMTTFFVSPLFEENQQVFNEIIAKV